MYDIDLKMERAIEELEGGETLDSKAAVEEGQLNSLTGWVLASERRTCLMATLELLESVEEGWYTLFYDERTDNFALAGPGLSWVEDGKMSDFIVLCCVGPSRWMDMYRADYSEQDYTSEGIADYVLEHLDERIVVWKSIGEFVKKSIKEDM